MARRHLDIAVAGRGAQGARALVAAGRARAAFTLIELLVVIAIIALLVSLLVPTLQQAREAAKEAVCMSNLRNLSQAVHQYGSEYGGWIPGATGMNPLTTAYGYPNKLPNNERAELYYDEWWFGKILFVMQWDADQANSYFDCPMDTKSKYAKGDGVHERFQFRYEGTVRPFMHFMGYEYSRSWISYGYSEYLGTRPNDQSLPESPNVYFHTTRAARPASTITMADKFDPHGGSNDGLITMDRRALPEPAPLAGISSVGRLHRGGANIAFLDSHVEWKNWFEVNPATTHWRDRRDTEDRWWNPER